MLTKKYFPWILGAVLLWQAIGIAQDYESRYTSRSNASGRDVVATEDGHYLVLGSGGQDIFLVKYKANLRRVWVKSHHFAKEKVHKVMVAALQEDCAVLASVGEQIKLLVFDLNDGHLKRTEDVDDMGGVVAIQDMVAYPDNRLLVGGNLSSEEQGKGLDWILMVLDLEGNIVYTKPYEVGSTTELLTQIQPTQDGGFVLVGNVIQDEWADLLVSKVKGPELDSLWSHHFDTRILPTALSMNQLNAGHWVTQSPDGSFYIAGSATYFKGQYQGICIKLDSEGNRVWRTPFNGRDQSDIVGRFVHTLEDGEIVFVAEKRLPENGGTRLCFARLSPEGEQLDMVEQVRVGQSCDWAGAANTPGNGFFYVKNCLSEQQEKLVVESEKILNLGRFFNSEKDKSERALRSLRWKETMSTKAGSPRQ